MDIETRISEFGDLLGEQFHTIHWIAEDDRLVNLQLRDITKSWLVRIPKLFQIGKSYFRQVHYCTPAELITEPVTKYIHAEHTYQLTLLLLATRCINNNTPWLSHDDCDEGVSINSVQLMLVTMPSRARLSNATGKGIVTFAAHALHNED